MTKGDNSQPQPVEVPAIKSNIVALRFPVRFSMCLRTIAGIIPRIPLPLIERILLLKRTDAVTLVNSL